MNNDNINNNNLKINKIRSTYGIQFVPSAIISNFSTFFTYSMLCLIVYGTFKNFSSTDPLRTFIMCDVSCTGAPVILYLEER